MVKILSQSGITLADAYNVEGSIAGIEQLESREVSLVHDMGGTLFSERFGTIIRRVSSGAIAQNLTFGANITNLPDGIIRILGVVVFVDSNRLDTCQVSLRDPTQGRDFPIFIWDTAVDSTVAVTMEDNGGGVAVHQQLRPAQPMHNLPSFFTRTDRPPFNTPDLVLRGLTAGFGAGTVVTTAIFYVAFNFQAGLSSRGLPIPGW